MSAFQAVTPRQLRQLWYLPLLAAAMAMMMARVLLMARLLDVPGFARYSAGLLVATTFVMLGCLGLFALFQRDMPVMLARGRSRRAMVRMMQCLLLAGALAGALIVLALPLGGAEFSADVIGWGLATGLSQQVFLLATTESRSHGEPVRYAWQNLWRAVAILGASGAAAAASGSAAWALAAEAIVSLALSAAIVAAASRRAAIRVRVLAGAAARGWRRLPWRAALVFLALSLATASLMQVDRWLSASLLGTEAFAQYAFAGVAVLIAGAVQSMVNASVYPMIARRYALAGRAVAFALGARVSLAVLAASLLLCLPAYALAAFAIGRWYPAYLPALALLPVLLPVCAARVSDFWSSYLAITGHERKLLALNLAVGALGCAAWATAMASRAGAAAPQPVDFAWLALVLAAGSHVTAAIVATLTRGEAPPHPAVPAGEPTP